MVSIRDTEVTLLEMVQPFDANSIGRLFGGRILEWIANVGTVATVKFSRGPTVLAYMDRHFFLAPAFIGDSITLKARVEYVGRSSMETYIEAVRRHGGDQVIMTMTTAAYVAVDDYGQPRLIRNELKPNPDELMIYNNARSRYEARKSKIVNRREERYNVNDPTENLRWRVESNRWVTPQDAFMSNMVSAGRLLAWIDNIAASLASEYAKSVVVTGSIDDTVFYSPIRTGEIVKIAVGISYVGKTSLETLIHVTTEDAYGNVKRVCTAYYTYIAIDDKGKPQPVPQYQPANDYERKLFEEGARRKMLRDEEIKRLKESMIIK
ncbi:acyl-CoA thioesterase [Caldivirga maquilingensis]|nr:acyl-CoA thioesterase [Caldivirga maquilingensis]